VLSQAARGVSACLYYIRYYRDSRITGTRSGPRNRTTGWPGGSCSHKISHSPANDGTHDGPYAVAELAAAGPHIDELGLDPVQALLQRGSHDGLGLMQAVELLCGPRTRPHRSSTGRQGSARHGRGLPCTPLIRTIFRQLLPPDLLNRELADIWHKAPMHARHLRRLRKATPVAADPQLVSRIAS